MNRQISSLLKLLRLVTAVLTFLFLLVQTSNPIETANDFLPRTTFLAPNISAAQQAECLDSGRARSATHAKTGRLRFIGAEVARPLARGRTLAPSASGEAVARDYLARCGSLFGVQDQSAELVTKRVKSLDRGGSHVRLHQVYRGVPILGGEMIVNLDDAKNITSVSGEIAPSLALATSPKIDAASARETALQVVAKKYSLTKATLTATAPELSIYAPALIGPGSGIISLVWRTEVAPKSLAPIREFVLIDAQRGGVTLTFNQVDTVKNRETYTANNGTVLPGTLVCNEGSLTCSGGDTHAVAAHTYSGNTYDFYSSYHARDSINGAGMTIRSSVHYSSGYCNAFWNGSQMVYGDGCGMPLADDVVAHELTHGVTQYESGLFYYYQSGAINESLSDVWGEFVDLTNGLGNDTSGVRWQTGEDISGLGAIRNMQNPPAFSDPDKMTSPYYYYDEGDNGGVHTNSGINNKAVYLMTDGGSFNGQTITGLGITKVAKIYYKAQTDLLTSGADYNDLYDALYQACSLLVGTYGITSGDCNQVRNATLAVEMNQQPTAGYNSDALLCGAAQTPSTIFYDTLESGTGNWTFGAFSGSNRWGSSSSFAHAGTSSLYSDDYPASATDTYAAMNTSVALPANARLHFSHAYGFEDSNYDGGVLEYSTNGGGSWNDAGSLIDTNGYKGTLKSGFGNPLAGRSAFVSESHGYISTRLNLNSLAGQSVRFRWRMALDSSIYDWGWWVDDVRIYSCVALPVTNSVYLPLIQRNYGSSSSNWINILTENFEGAFPGPWTLYTTNGYTFGKRDCRFNAGSSGGWAVGGGGTGSGLGCKSNYPDYASSWMVYGPFSLVGANAAEFRYKVYQYSESGYDYLGHYASINGSSFSGWIWSGSSGGWSERVFNLNNVPSLGNLLGQPNVWIALRFYSDGVVNYRDGAHVDDIILRKCTSSCTTIAAPASQSSGAPSFDAPSSPYQPTR